MAGDCPIFIFTGEHYFAFAGRVDGDPVKNICVDPNQVPVAQIVRPGVKNFFNFLWQRIDKTARRRAHVNLIFFFLRNTANL